MATPNGMGKEKFLLGKSDLAIANRKKQLLNWENSDTNRQSGNIDSVRRRRSRVQFSNAVVFLAASASGDLDEVEKLLTEKNANVNSTNEDGLTALHQVKLCVREGEEGGREGREGGREERKCLCLVCRCVLCLCGVYVGGIRIGKCTLLAFVHQIHPPI